MLRFTNSSNNGTHCCTDLFAMQAVVGRTLGQYRPKSPTLRSLQGMGCDSKQRHF